VQGGHLFLLTEGFFALLVQGLTKSFGFSSNFLVEPVNIHNVHPPTDLKKKANFLAGMEQEHRTKTSSAGRLHNLLFGAACTGSLVHSIKKALREAIEQGEKGSESRCGDRVPLGLVCKVHESEGGGTEEVESAIYEQSLLAPELRQARGKKAIKRRAPTMNVRSLLASSHRSHLSGIPLAKLFPGRNDILVYKHPTVEPSYAQRHPGSDLHWKIPVAEWPKVLHRIDQGEPLRKVADDYGVSHETIRRLIRSCQKKGASSDSDRATGND
jgi:hypothetical protein